MSEKSLVLQLLDALFRHRHKFHTVVLGDYNAYPESVLEGSRVSYHLWCGERYLGERPSLIDTLWTILQDMSKQEEGHKV